MKAKYQLDNVNRLTEGILKGGGLRHVYLEMPSTSGNSGGQEVQDTPWAAWFHVPNFD